MNFNVKRPCRNCPFRRVGAIELHPERLPGIVRALLADDHGWFICHKTAHGVEADDDDGDMPRYVATGRESQCAGAMVYLLKCGRPSVSMRLAAHVGLLDFADLRAQFPCVIDATEQPST